MNSQVCYQHKDDQGRTIGLPVGKVVCIGRNYMAHINELNNEVPEQPLYFMKPADSLVDINQPINFPRHLGRCHHELEVAVLITQRLHAVSIEQAEDAIWGVGLALDLTLRDLQTELKTKGQPWERAKAFDRSCPVSTFISKDQLEKPELAFSLRVNEQLRQEGHTKNMMLKMDALISDVSHIFTLNPGDVVLTGTPEGVAELKAGDKLSLKLDKYLSIRTQVGEASISD